MGQANSFYYDFIFVGKLKPTSPFYDLFNSYEKRLLSKNKIFELGGSSQKEELINIAEKIDPSAALIALDETGQTYKSQDFAEKLEKFQISHPKIQFVIGGADGLSDDIRQKAKMILSFGKQTWPHMMARVMLIEQVYRAQQILANHPYHRE